MDIETLARQLEDSAALPELVASLSNANVAALVDQLKSEADRHWWINANRSLALAELIVQVGQARGDVRHTALGTMARGDALKFLGQLEPAWEALEAAGWMFQAAADEVGWARTRIGRLVICVELNRVGEALADASMAREIFARQGEHERLLGLEHNMSIVYVELGDCQKALQLCLSALAIAEASGKRTYRHLGLLYIDTGRTYHMLGDFRAASAYYDRSRVICAERNEMRGVALAELNLAHIAMSQGRHRQALQLLHHSRDLYLTEQLTLDALYASQDMVENYLLLNRYQEASDLARQIIAGYHKAGAAYREGLTQIHLATSEAALGDFEAVQAALDAAESIFTALGASAWVATTQLRRGQIALNRGDDTTAARTAQISAAFFKSGGQQVEYAAAILLHGQALFRAGDIDAAVSDGTNALQIACDCNVPSLRYSAHLLLGNIARAKSDLARARRRYTAAIATVERVQRGLTITLRPGFLENKGEALCALLTLYFHSGNAQSAFETLERAKSQVLLSYLANREQFHWSSGDARSQALIEELNRLREEHQWFFRLAHGQSLVEDDIKAAIESQQAREEVSRCERRMRAITEQLYLEGDNRGINAAVAAPRLQDVQRNLEDGTLLIEFYNDGAQVWAFSVDAQTLEVHSLPLPVGDLDRLVSQLQINIAVALSAGPAAPIARNLNSLAQRILQRLYAGLLGPLARRIQGRRRLLIVPYGSLHYLPFHLLYNGSSYLIDQYEIVILPAAGLVTRPALTRPEGALALAYSWDGRLPQTLAETRIVQRLFGGQAHFEAAAGRSVLQSAPVQVLHIAAHGEHRLDQPDLSYIQLADGQLYTDDVLQHDLSYELVTLSACETGRANVAAGDELIGLGRGFLYAGAGALITSLWRVADDTTVALMERLYGSLRAGASKAAALQQTQRAVLVEEPDLHPAFWGAFQLVGDAGPLSARQHGSASRKLALTDDCERTIADE